ncbi:hypothetical protein BJV77DRAFT_1006700, partial [Russula vinacea]
NSSPRLLHVSRTVIKLCVPVQPFDYALKFAVRAGTSKLHAHVALYVALCQINILQSGIRGVQGRRTQNDCNSLQLTVESYIYSFRHRRLVIPSSTCLVPLISQYLPFFSRFIYICFTTLPCPCAVMSLSVSSFPEAPPTAALFGTLLNKRPVPFLKGIGHLAKAHVKGSIVHLRVNVPWCRSQLPSSLSRSSRIESSSIVIDIFPIPNCDECCFTDADASSLGPTIELSSSSRSISPAAPSTPSTENAEISMADPVEGPHRSSQYSDSVGDPAHTREECTAPSERQEEVASAVCDSEPHDSPQPSDSDATIIAPISRHPTTQPLATPSMIPRVRSHSVSPVVKASPTETIPPSRRPRYKSETAVGPRRRTASSSSPDRKGARGKNSTSTSAVPPLPSSAHTSSIAQKREIRSNTLSMGSSRSSSSTKAAEFQITTNHRLRPKTPPPLPLPPNSLDRGTWLRLVALPHAESGVPHQQQQHRPRAASEAVLTTS